MFMLYFGASSYNFLTQEPRLDPGTPEKQKRNYLDYKLVIQFSCLNRKQ